MRAPRRGCGSALPFLTAAPATGGVLRESHPGRRCTSTEGVGMTVSDRSNEQEERAARNQTLFREINEQVKALNEGFSLLTPMGEWVCECANTRCVEHLELSAEEYEAVRKNPTCFVVAPSDEHVFLDVEAVVKTTERYWVVAKTGPAGEVARRNDPRSTGPLPLKT
jgi:hypothetical protein